MLRRLDNILFRSVCPCEKVAQSKIPNEPFVFYATLRRLKLLGPAKGGNLSRESEVTGSAGEPDDRSPINDNGEFRKISQDEHGRNTKIISKPLKPKEKRLGSSPRLLSPTNKLTRTLATDTNTNTNVDTDAALRVSKTRTTNYLQCANQT